jgi:hypothetical protein
MIRRLLSDHEAASAAEFALVLPLLLVLLLGLIDTGRWMWTYNRAEKATQMGARFAVVTNYVPSGLNTSYVGVGGLTQGDSIPAGAFGKIQCTSGTPPCDCVTSPCPPLGTFTTQNFTNVVDRMRFFMPEIQNANVTLEYSSSGLGYAGNPNGPDLAPIVTVRLSGVSFQPLICQPFGCASFSMPTFLSSLTFEDGAGTQSN